MQARNNDKKITFFLIALAFIIRLSLISKGPYYIDALELAIKAEGTLQTPSLNYMHAPGHPLVVILTAALLFFMRLIGISDPVFSANFMSVIFGSLGIGAFYLLARKFLDELGALISSLILCFLPLHIYISTIGFNHPVSIFFHLTGIYFLFLYLEEYKLNRLIWSAVLLGLGAASRLADSPVMVAVIFLYLVWSLKNSNFTRKLILKRLVGFLFVYSVTTIIFYVPAFFTGAFAEMKSFASGLYYLYYEPRALIVALKEIAPVLDGGGVVLLIAGAGYFFVHKNRILFYFLLVWFLGLVLYYGSMSIAVVRYFLFPLLPACIFVGYFLSRLGRKKILLCYLMLVLIIINFFNSYPIIYFRHIRNVQKQFVEFLENSTEPNSYIIAVDEGLFIEYYSNRQVLYKATGSSKEKFDNFFKDVDKLLEQNTPIYIITMDLYVYDPKKYFIDTLTDRYNLLYVGEHQMQAWHNQNLISYNLFKEKLYRIERKKI